MRRRSAGGANRSVSCGGLDDAGCAGRVSFMEFLGCRVLSAGAGVEGAMAEPVVVRCSPGSVFRLLRLPSRVRIPGIWTGRGRRTRPRCVVRRRRRPRRDAAAGGHPAAVGGPRRA
jgi:hypothetical protein